MITVEADHCAPLLWVNEDPLWAPLAVGPPEYLIKTPEYLIKTPEYLITTPEYLFW